MIISCENCGKKFKIDDNLISEKGTLVQCGSCQHKWHQKKNNIDNTVKISKKNDFLIDRTTSISDDKKSRKTKTKKITEKQKIRNTEIEKISKQLKKEKDLAKSSLASKTKTPKKIKKVGFLSYLIIIIITLISIYIILDTFEYQITMYWPKFKFYFSYINETLINIYILIKDLIKSYS